MEYLYNSKESLMQLENDLKEISLNDKAYLVLVVMKDNLMQVHPALEPIISLLDNNNTAIFAPSMAEQAPQDVIELWDETINYMVNGHDTYDEKSAGGWNKDELELFVKHLKERGCLKSLENDAPVMKI